MAYTIVRHRVNDYATWRKAFDALEPQRKQGGERSAAVINTWDSVSAAKAFFDSPALKGAMESAGVAGPPDFLFADEA